MAAVTAIIAAASLAAGMYNANRANQKAGDALNAQKDARAQDLAFRNKVYEDEYAFREPLRRKLSQQVFSDKPVGYDAAKDAIERNYSNVDKATDTALALRGSGAGDSMGAATIRANILNKARDLSKAWRDGQMTKNNIALSLLHNAQVNPNLVTEGNDRMAGMWGDMARMYGGAAAGGWSGIGKGVNALAQMYGRENNPTVESTAIPTQGADTSSIPNGSNGFSSMDSSAFTPASTNDMWGGGTPYSDANWASGFTG